MNYLFFCGSFSLIQGYMRARRRLPREKMSFIDFERLKYREI
jgi:hypothetical protein